MATYIYMSSDGSLYSWNASDSDPVADDVTLATQGMAKKAGLPPLDSTHAWDAATRNVVVVAVPKSTPQLQEFWERFTVAEREGIENLAATGTQNARNQINAFLRYAHSRNVVDCNDPYVLSSVQKLETAGVLSSGRAAQIVV
jgi:hypothetical protein